MNIQFEVFIQILLQNVVETRTYHYLFSCTVPPRKVNMYLVDEKDNNLNSNSVTAFETRCSHNDGHQIITVTEGKKTSLVCEILGSRPEPLVVWKKDGRNLIDSKPRKVNSYSPSPSGDDSVSMSVLDFEPTVDDHNSIISCTTVSPKLPDTPLSGGVSLNVLCR